jgi:hypothetical protein
MGTFTGSATALKAINDIDRVLSNSSIPASTPVSMVLYWSGTFYIINLGSLTPAPIATGITSLYATSVGNGSGTSFTVTHGLGTTDISVQVRDATNNDPAFPEIQIVNGNSITVAFGGVTPATNQYRVVVIGT